jgi:WbqC-like protein family
MRSVAMMQPTFLPWAGYFALMDAADCFVLLDDFQFQRRSFHQRNRLFVGGERVGWVTVPVEHSHGTDFPLLCDLRPVLTSRSRAKLRALLSHNYGFSDYFTEVAAAVEAVIERDWQSLADLNIALIEALASLLGITTVLLRSSPFKTAGPRSERIADLLHKVHATTFLAAAGAEAFLREDRIFPLEDIDTLFQDYLPYPYPQRHSDAFVPYLSVLDMLFQLGPAHTRDVVRAGGRDFLPWQPEAMAS